MNIKSLTGYYQADAKYILSRTQVYIILAEQDSAPMNG